MTALDTIPADPDQLHDGGVESAADVPRETAAPEVLADGLPAQVVIHLDEYTIAEMDRVEEYVRAGHGRMTVLTWIALRRDGYDVPIETVANLKSSRMRVIRESAVPLATA